MDKPQEERWHCMDAACAKEAIVPPAEVPAGRNPRCGCGTEMKKDYSPPVFRYLEFLRLGEPVLSEHALLEE